MALFFFICESFSWNFFKSFFLIILICGSFILRGINFSLTLLKLIGRLFCNNLDWSWNWGDWLSYLSNLLDHLSCFLIISFGFLCFFLLLITLSGFLLLERFGVLILLFQKFLVTHKSIVFILSFFLPKWFVFFFFLDLNNSNWSFNSNSGFLSWNYCYWGFNRFWCIKFIYIWSINICLFFWISKGFAITDNIEINICGSNFIIELFSSLWNICLLSIRKNAIASLDWSKLMALSLSHVNSFTSWQESHKYYAWLLHLILN